MLVTSTTVRSKVIEKENCIMKKMLVGLFVLAALAVGVQVTQAACPCSSPCAVSQPCDPCAAAPCTPCCRKKCTWWKIFENKCCCDKPNCECQGCGTCKRCYWWKFWEDRCCVKPGPDCCPKCNCCD